MVEVDDTQANSLEKVKCVVCSPPHPSKKDQKKGHNKTVQLLGTWLKQVFEEQRRMVGSTFTALPEHTFFSNQGNGSRLDYVAYQTPQVFPTHQKSSTAGAQTR